MGLLSVGGVQIDVGANLQPLRNDLRQAERELQNLNRNLASGTGAGGQSLGAPFTQANQQAGSFFRTVRAGAQDFLVMTGAAYAAYKSVGMVAGQAYDLAKLGWEAERAQVALRNMLGSPDEATRWIESLKDATHGAVTEAEAAGMAYQVLRLGLADSAQAAGEFTRVAAIIGAASPQLASTSDAISEIALTIANTSWRRLDQLGLSVSDVKARVDALRESGMSLEDAFRVAVLEGLTEQANILGDEILEIGGNTQRLQTRFEELKTDVGWIIGQGFEWAADKILDTAEAIGWVIDKFDELSGYEAARQRGYTTPGDFAGQAGGLRQMLELTSPYAAAVMYGNYGALGLERPSGAARYPGEPQMLSAAALRRWRNRHVYGDAMGALGTTGYYGYAASATMGPSAPRGGYVGTQQWATEQQQLREELRAREAEIGLMQRYYERELEQARSRRREERWQGVLTTRHATEQAGMGQIDAAHAEAFQERMQENTGKALDFLAQGMNRAGAQLGAAVQASLDAVTLPQSIAELVGLVQEGGLKGEMYGAGMDAARAAGLDDETLDRLDRLMGFKYGQTNPGMELFNQLLDENAEKLATGEINAMQFMDQLDRMQAMNFDRINAAFDTLLDTGRWDAALRIMDRVMETANPDYRMYALEQATQRATDPLLGARARGAMLLEGEDPHQWNAWATSARAQSGVDQIDAQDEAMRRMANNAVGYIGEIKDAWTGVADQAETELARVEGEIRALDGSTIHVTVTATAGTITIPWTIEPSPIPVGGRDAQTVAAPAPFGSSTGRTSRLGGRAGGGPVSAGLWEVNEPGVGPEVFEQGGRSYLLVPPGASGTVRPLASNGGSRGLVIQGDVHIHGVQDPHAIWDGLVAEAQRRNVTIGARA